jgi:hypothetical protein
MVRRLALLAAGDVAAVSASLPAAMLLGHANALASQLAGPGACGALAGVVRVQLLAQLSSARRLGGVAAVALAAWPAGPPASCAGERQLSRFWLGAADCAGTGPAAA